MTERGKQLAGDLKVLYHMTFFSRKGSSHAERLDDYYGEQADHYDQFRERLLHGRRELFAGINVPKNGIWADFGGGTGANAEYLGDDFAELKKFYVVDLSQSLLRKARERIARHGWTRVEPVHGDVCQPLFAESSCDVVTFSYALTMIPEWFAAIDEALRVLKPGGVLGVSDFFVDRKHDGRSAQSWFRRHFWPAWFRIDNVFLNPDHVPYLTRRLEEVSFRQRLGPLPLCPLVRVPYYVFIGRKPAAPAASPL